MRSPTRSPLEKFWGGARRPPVNQLARALAGLSPTERIDLVRLRVPAWFVADLVTDMGVPKERLYDAMGVARSTIERKVRTAQPLSLDESERAVGIAQLVGLAQRMFDESGDATDFDAARWVGDWLNTPHPALGGKTPADYFDTAEGRQLVSNLLARQQSGAYA
jgi:putative toxin-antitoxin system antitoxin component (TIGR02293 family)